MKAAYKTALMLGAVAAAGVYLTLCSRAYIAQSRVHSASTAELRRAIRVAGDSSALHYALGRRLWLEDHDVQAAMQEYEAAVRLNPYPADYWIELAAASSVAGDAARRDDAILRAERAAPYDTAVLWDVANLNLMRGDTFNALHQMRTAMQYGAANWNSYLELCWKVTGSVDTIMAEAVPPSHSPYETLLGLTTYLNRVEDSEKVWRRAESLNIAIAPQQALPYFNFLLAHGRAADALEQWRHYAAATPEMHGYAPQSGNLVVNANFALPVLNAGFDWRYGAQPDVAVSIDKAAGGGAGSSLAIGFDGSPVDAGIYQLVAVTPGAGYRISARVRSEIEAVDGPRLAAFDAASHKLLGATDAVTGNTGWHDISAAFHVPPSTSLIAVRIIRLPSASQIRGHLWVAEVTLRAGS